MQFGLQNIRRWGSLKALQVFSLEDIIGQVRVLSGSHKDKCSSPYSFPAKWEVVRGSAYSGLKEFMLQCEPMIDNVKVDDICKRRFRNMWHRVWDNIAQDFSLTDADKLLLSSFGIQLAFVTQDLGVVTKFYNFVLKWAIFSMNSLNFEKNGMTAIGIVDMIVGLDADCFVDKILYEVN